MHSREAIASKGELSTLHDDARVAAELRRETLTELRRDGAIPDLSRIEIAVNEHQAVIDEEFELLAADRIDQARVLGNARQIRPRAGAGHREPDEVRLPPRRRQQGPYGGPRICADGSSRRGDGRASV